MALINKKVTGPFIFCTVAPVVFVKKVLVFVSYPVYFRWALLRLFFVYIIFVMNNNRDNTECKNIIMPDFFSVFFHEVSDLDFRSAI